MKIGICTTTFGKVSPEPIKILNENNFQLLMNNLHRKLYDNEIIELASDCIGIIAGNETYSKEVLNELKKLKVISRLGVGMDNIDTEYVNNKNIKVFKTNTTPALAVAELTLGLIFNLSRKISYHHINLKNKRWDKNMGELVSGKTLGIIGLGAIGKTLLKLVSGFGLKILAYDRIIDQGFSDKKGVKYCNINELMEASDIISIHLNLDKDTYHLIDMPKIKLMKNSAIIINTSRGGIIDEDALYLSLSKNKIAGAALDVFNNEPYDGPLCSLDNVILTPHIGAYAREVRMRMEIESVINLLQGLD